jgi:hypothetical protein
LGRRIVKRLSRIGPDGANGRQTHNHDQGQHDGIFNRCRAVFRDEKTFDFRCETSHGIPPVVDDDAMLHAEAAVPQ